MEALRETLLANPWFAALEPDLFEKLAALARPAAWAANQTIFREGETDPALYLVLAGQVALEIHIPNRGRVRFLTVGPAELLGWSATLSGTYRKTASARALEPTHAAAFDSDALRMACEADHELGFHVYRRLTNVIASRLAATRLQLLDMYAVGPTQSP